MVFFFCSVFQFVFFLTMSSVYAMCDVFAVASRRLQTCLRDLGAFIEALPAHEQNYLKVNIGFIFSRKKNADNRPPHSYAYFQNKLCAFVNRNNLFACNNNTQHGNDSKIKYLRTLHIESWSGRRRPCNKKVATKLIGSKEHDNNYCHKHTVYYFYL